MLGIAIVIGALAALGARNHPSQGMGAIQARGKGEQVQVVVAKGKMQKGDVLSAASLAVRGIPSDFAHSNALLPDQFDSFEGKVLAYGVKAGEMILWSMLEGKKAASFSARVEEGGFATTVPIPGMAWSSPSLMSCVTTLCAVLGLILRALLSSRTDGNASPGLSCPETRAFFDA